MPRPRLVGPGLSVTIKGRIMKIWKLALCMGALPLAACSSVIEGTSQEILVNTNPAGANCTFDQPQKAPKTVGVKCSKADPQ